MNKLQLWFRMNKISRTLFLIWVISQEPNSKLLMSFTSCGRFMSSGCLLLGGFYFLCFHLSQSFIPYIAWQKLSWTLRRFWFPPFLFYSQRRSWWFFLLRNLLLDPEWFPQHGSAPGILGRDDRGPLYHIKTQPYILSHSYGFPHFLPVLRHPFNYLFTFSLSSFAVF